MAYFAKPVLTLLLAATILSVNAEVCQMAIQVSLTPDDAPKETSWDLQNSGSSTILSYSIGDELTKSVTEVCSGYYSLRVYDSYGDGICCEYGEGQISVSISSSSSPTDYQLLTTATDSKGSDYEIKFYVDDPPELVHSHEYYETAEPSKSPTASPVSSPSASPSSSPSTSPSASPSAHPTSAPSSSPTTSPSASPSVPPTSAPSRSPVVPPTRSPTRTPVSSPTHRFEPSAAPSASPSAAPTASPTVSPTAVPSSSPSSAPSAAPSTPPTATPTGSPTATPSYAPSSAPTAAPSSYLSYIIGTNTSEVEYLDSPEYKQSFQSAGQAVATASAVIGTAVAGIASVGAAAGSAGAAGGAVGSTSSLSGVGGGGGGGPPAAGIGVSTLIDAGQFLVFSGMLSAPIPDSLRAFASGYAWLYGVVDLGWINDLVSWTKGTFTSSSSGSGSSNGIKSFFQLVGITSGDFFLIVFWFALSLMGIVTSFFLVLGFLMWLVPGFMGIDGQLFARRIVLFDVYKAFMFRVNVLFYTFVTTAALYEVYFAVNDGGNGAAALSLSFLCIVIIDFLFYPFALYRIKDIPDKKLDENARTRLVYGGFFLKWQLPLRRFFFIVDASLKLLIIVFKIALLAYPEAQLSVLILLTLCQIVMLVKIHPLRNPEMQKITTIISVLKISNLIFLALFFMDLPSSSREAMSIICVLLSTSSIILVLFKLGKAAYAAFRTRMDFGKSEVKTFARPPKETKPDVKSVEILGGTFFSKEAATEDSYSESSDNQPSSKIQ